MEASPDISLRRASRAARMVICGMIVLTAGALALSTTLLNRATNKLGEAIESVRISQAMAVQLNAHSRALLFFEASGGGLYVPGVPALELSLRRLAAEAAQHTDSDAERTLVERARVTIEAYLDTEAQLDAGPATPARRLEVLGPRFDAAIAAIDELVWFNADDARMWRERAETYDDVSNVMAAVVVFIMGLLSLGLSRFLSRDLLGVIEAMHAAVVRFAAGEITARAPVRGVRELGDLARAFNETADALVRWKQGAISFQLGIATQLRDPLTVIKLRLRAPDKDGSAPARSRSIEEQVHRMDLMIRDLIDAALISGGKLELSVEQRDLRPLVEEAVLEQRALAPDRRIVLTMPVEPLDAPLDAARIEHVARNLLSNALKFSAPESTVTVAVLAQGDHATMTVSDHGIGMTPEELSRVFEPFQRKGISSGHVSGEGLGLRATRMIVEAHGGTLEVESVPRLGSTFRVSLPRKAP